MFRNWQYKLALVIFGIGMCAMVAIPISMIVKSKQEPSPTKYPLSDGALAACKRFSNSAMVQDAIREAREGRE